MEPDIKYLHKLVSSQKNKYYFKFNFLDSTDFNIKQKIKYLLNINYEKPLMEIVIVFYQLL